MKTLQIDEKFSVVYDDENNDRPMYIDRLGSRHANLGIDTPNWIIAAFYALIQIDHDITEIENANIEITTDRMGQDDPYFWTEGDIL